MADGKILYFQDKEQCYFKFIGEIRHTLCPGFDAALKRAFNDIDITIFFIDLKSATYLDSTSLGLIAKIARFTYAHKFPKPIIFSTNENVNIILHSMGFEEIFRIIHQETPDIQQMTVLESTELGIEQTREMILEAHRILVDMNDKNRNVFQNVVELLSTHDD
jgi:anti-anti-sigma factor